MKKDIRYQKEVLIETYWNVKDIADLLVVNLTSINRNILECKDGCFSFDESRGIVLIETYWNVKMVIPGVVAPADYGMNRNILECKGRKDRAGHRAAGQY